MTEEKTLYANFGYRLLAFAIDRVILSAIGYALGFIFGFLYVSASGGSHGIQWLGNGLTVLITWIYYASFESSKYQATFGKRIVGIRVTDMEGKRISFGKATARHFAKIISWLTIGIGFLMIIWTPKKQGLHDKIAHTLVVRK